ncbi:MAG: hypothetical protein NWQ43_01995 [Dolichospermum sp.]|uniref:hypothetical protein n=1 Tax=Anabaena sp. UHCC 0187 TaxID=2590018 RepID=UPI001447E5E8|nr:hypothetical protein [Anabaena sp. UHCC 0187]MDP5016078.1 hypothetical protein [Dolichospermum sp.]
MLRLAVFKRKNIRQEKYFGKLAAVIHKNHDNDGAALASMISHKMLLWEAITHLHFPTFTNALSYYCWGNLFPNY